MSSRDSGTECYVYITLPGETSFITAAKFALSKNRRGVSTGRLVYGRGYLAGENALPIDPIELIRSKNTSHSPG